MIAMRKAGAFYSKKSLSLKGAGVLIKVTVQKWK